MAFKKFIRKGYSTTPSVSLWARGQIAFNASAVDEFGLVEGYVNLMHDTDTNKIGFEFLTDPEEGSLKLKKSHGYMACTCKPFVGTLGVNFPATNITGKKMSNPRRQFPLEFDAGMLVADLAAGSDTEDTDENDQILE